MNIPENIEIGYKTFNIIKVEGNVVDGNKVCYGNIEHDNGKIHLSNIYDEDQQKCTFLHEVIHGIDELFEIGLEEDMVRKLAKGIYLFIKSNPDIFKNNCRINTAAPDQENCGI